MEHYKYCKIAILVDGGFFHKRIASIFKQCHNFNRADPKQSAEIFRIITRMHAIEAQGLILYRIFYYDCKPLDKRVTNPISKKTIDFSKSDTAIFRNAFFEELKRQRKVALRLGTLKDYNEWKISPQTTKMLLSNKKSNNEITEEDLQYDIKQKGVDMKIGLDISALAYKRLVDRIVLIAGDSDFVPAAKVARREGIDFILDPLWSPISDDLYEHIDGIHSTCPHPNNLPSKIEDFIKTYTDQTDGIGEIPQYKNREK